MIQLLKRAASLYLTTALIIGIIASQPYDNPARGFFGEDCPIPCWQGIRPSVTTRAEADDILLQHPWVGQTGISVFPEGRATDAVPTFYEWQWTAAFPYPSPLLDFDTLFLTNVLGIRSGITQRDGVDRVGSLNLVTGLRAADLWLLYGVPQAFTSGYLTADIPIHQLTLFTLGGSGVSATAYQQCPLDLKSLWESPVTVQLTSPGQIAPARATSMRTLFALLEMRNAQLC